MSFSAAASTANRPRGLQVLSVRARLLLLLPAADFLFLVGSFVFAGILGSGAEWDSDSLGLFVYNLLSPVALAALVVLTAGLWPRGMPVTALTCVLFSGLFVFALLGMFTSSTGVLLLLFLPIYFCIALVPFAGLGVLVHGLRRRRLSSLEGQRSTNQTARSHKRMRA